MKKDRQPRSGFRTITVLAYFALLLVYILYHNVLKAINPDLRVIITVAAWSLFFLPVVIYLVKILIQDIRRKRAGFSAIEGIILVAFLTLVVWRIAFIMPAEIRSEDSMNKAVDSYVEMMSDTSEPGPSAEDKKAAYDQWISSKDELKKNERMDAILLLFTLVPLFLGWFTLICRDGKYGKDTVAPPPAAPVPPMPPMPPQDVPPAQ
ncbi:MAG: hypothetical protein MJ192_10845 [Clostridia bacterium]|nr:hypothetical protein [Clostridia bacterium]